MSYRYRSTKTYGAEVGLSCAFRQWRADSHCRFIHGYALGITVTFEAQTLDRNGWVIDFGGLKTLKQQLVDRFDHKLLVAGDDPYLPGLQALTLGTGAADVVVVPATGCEAFAQQVCRMAQEWLLANGHTDGRVRVHSVEVREHGANSAIFLPNQT